MKKLFPSSFVTPGLRVVGLLALTLVASIEARAALMASDNAGNYTTWSNGDNQGSGFGTWSLPLNTAGRGEFLATGNNGNSQINNGGNSWGLYANSGQTADAVRSFTGGSLGIGQQFLIKMDNGNIQTGGTVGFGLQNGSGANRFEFYFVGGQTQYTINANGIGSQSGPGFTTGGLNIIFSQLAANNFSVQVDVLAGGGSTTYTGTLAASDISQLRFFNFNAGDNGLGGHDLFFNDIAVVPEPVTVALGIFGALGGVGGLVRLRFREKLTTEMLKR